jgi:outer membrane biosynthesis protein TonB
MQQAETQPAEPPQPEMQQAETQPAEAPQPEVKQAETQPAEPPQPEMQQAETQPAKAPQPAMQQAEAQPAEAPQPNTQQAEVTRAVAPLGKPQQPQTRQAATPQVEPPQGALAAVPAAGFPRDVKWTVFVELEYGTRLDVPGAVFATPDGPANRGVGRQFKTPDGRASLAVYSQRNDARDTPASYLRKNLQSSRTGLDYERVTPEFFAIAAVMGDSIYYSRCNFSRNAGRAIHCFDLKYPVQERQSWDGIVTRMSRSLRPLQGG